MDSRWIRMLLVILCALSLTLPYAYAEKVTKTKTVTKTVTKPASGEEASASTVTEEVTEEVEEEEIVISDPTKNEEMTRKISVRKKLSELELKLVGPVFSTEM